jgi:flagellar basal-body rod protein FlgB
MDVSTPMSAALGRYLDLASDQMKLTAGNIANVDTPGYKTQGFNFESAFSQELTTQGDPGENPGLAAATDVQGLVTRPDGNNVSMDREGMQLSKAQLQFRLGVQLLKREYTNVMAAIHAEAK